MSAERLPAPLRLLLVEEVAERLAFSVRSVRALIAGGRLPIVRVGARAVRVDEADLARYIDTCRQRSPSSRRSTIVARQPQARPPLPDGDATSSDAGVIGDVTGAAS